VIHCKNRKIFSKTVSCPGTVGSKNVKLSAMCWKTTRGPRWAGRLSTTFLAYLIVSIFQKDSQYPEGIHSPQLLLKAPKRRLHYFNGYKNHEGPFWL